MSYVTEQLAQVNPGAKDRPLVSAKLKFVSAWGQTNYLTIKPDTFRRIAEILKEAEVEYNPHG